MLISPERTKKFINNRAFFTQNGKSKENETLELVQMEVDKKEEVRKKVEVEFFKSGEYFGLLSRSLQKCFKN